jgi:F420-0:gamma-glutamyl ligase
MDDALAKPVVTVRGIRWERHPVQTHLIQIKEPLVPVFEQYAVPQLRAGDWLAVSEKFVTISQGRVIHQSVVHPGWLARLLVRGVTKHTDDVGYSDPRKMQVAIMQAGRLRMVVAMIVGAATRLVGRHGDFYRVAGHRVSEIDGFNPATVKPFDEFAMLGPEDPPRDAAEIASAIGFPVAIVDANNINVEVLGTSPGFPLDAEATREVLLDNPMGQGDERTPIIIVRRAQ